MKFSRRELAAVVTTSVAAAAQNQPAAPPDDLTAQGEQLKRNLDALATVRITETLEPSFVFKP